jgi:hypothetical protein
MRYYSNQTVITLTILQWLSLSVVDRVSAFSIRDYGRRLDATGARFLQQDAFASRRQILSSLIVVTAGGVAMTLTLPAPAHASTETPTLLQDLLPIMKQARDQLEPIPGLIKAEKWDSVRAILIQPPLSDCWAKGGKMLLPNYATAIGDAGGDELAALEAREEVITHLRFLDMAVYNNVFNPIGTEGTTGATKELVRSYYEDPINEYKASIAAMDELVQLGAQ